MIYNIADKIRNDDVIQPNRNINGIQLRNIGSTIIQIVNIPIIIPILQKTMATFSYCERLLI